MVIAPPRLLALVVLGGLLAAPLQARAVGAAVENGTENWNRLRSMPREQRLALLEKLKAFEALSSSEQAAIRALDEKIAKLPAADQADYWSVLRRYHQWVQGLTDEQRNELNSAPPAERMKVVTKLRAQERSGEGASAVPLFLQVVDFATMSPFDMAHRLKTWFELPPEKRAEIEALSSPAEQQKQLNDLAAHAKPGPVHRFTKAEEDMLMARIEANPQLKSRLANPLKKLDPTKQEKLRRRIAANFYFLDKPPAAVESSRLMRFEAALPPWYRGQFDHLSPDEARRRLTILYRLVYPAPAEMPEIPKAAGARPAAAPPPRRGPAPSATNPY